MLARSRLEAWCGRFALEAAAVGAFVSCTLQRYEIEAARLEVFADSLKDQGDAALVRAMAARIRAMLASVGYSGGCGD